MSFEVPSRARRLLEGWSANLVQLVLGITQQVALVPVFLHFGSSELLAGWLALYAAGNLTLIADAGLQSRAINRFLAMKSSIDSDGRSANYYAAMLRVYGGLIGLLIVAVIAGSLLLRPSHVFGFQAAADFDPAFVVMVIGMLLVLSSNPAAGFYRTRGLYGRAVWMQNAAMLVSQLGQLVAIVATKNLLVIALVYVVPQILAAGYLWLVDARSQFPFLYRGGRRRRPSWRWTAGQFRKAFPFAIASTTEIALQNLPVLLVSAIVIDRVAVAQWGLTRVTAGLVRAVCVQATLPLAAELGHDRAIGAKVALRRLYARGSVFVTGLASLVVSAFLAFWPDFFGLWTRGAVPYDAVLTLTLLIGALLVSPSMLALGFAYYSDRGELLARTKGLQLVVFLVLALVLTTRLGALGAAIAVVASDLLVQFGLLALPLMRETLERPLRHLLFLALVMALVTTAGWALGLALRFSLPGTGLGRFAGECVLWLVIVGLAAGPLASKRLRERLMELVPA